MSTAFRAFMAALIDYAGLFPPAALDMQAAVDRYAAHRRLAEAWMLHRFIAPAEGLGAFAAAAGPHLKSGERWGLTVLVGARDDAAVALARTDAQGDAVAGLEAATDDRAQVEALETAVPAAAAGAGCGDFLARLGESLADAGLGGRELFVETPSGGDDAAVLEAIAGMAARFAGPDGAFPRIGVKLRCGGLVADAFPSPGRLAAVIAAAGDLGLALKFTAGLHHPVRHRADDPAVMMHGFLNVFGAGILAREAGLAGDRLIACLAETEPAAFTFTEAGFAWRDLGVDTDAVARARSRWLAGFGSCSFLEPRDDLAALGLL